MGFIDWLLGRTQSNRAPEPEPSGRRAYTDSDVHVIAQSASRLVDVINESVELAKNSKNVETKLSRLEVARDKLESLKDMARQYPFLILESLAEVEAEIAGLELQFQQKGYRELAAGNEQGRQLEKDGRIDKAIAVYESLAERGTDTPFTYRRLAILYRKQKNPEQELRVLRLAIENVPISNATHFAWFEERYKKMLLKSGGNE